MSDNTNINNTDTFTAQVYGRVGIGLPPIPVYSDWECQLLYWTWNPEVGKVPCWFYRKMQTILLGAKWKKK